MTSVIVADVVVIGGGLAGHMAALEAARRGREVALISKTQPFRTHSSIAGAGINLAVRAGDSWRDHAGDVWNDGHFLSDWDPVEVMTREGPELVLSEFGDLLDRDGDGQVVSYQFGGTARGVRAGKNTGMQLIRRCHGLLADEGVRIYPYRMVTSLVTDGGECLGVTALDLLTGEIEAFAASSVILCGGGFGHAFQNTAHASHMSGDAHALAFRAGAALKDMEFVRFNETSLYAANCAITESIGRKGAHLYNRDGERFLARYDPRMEAVEPFYLKRYMQLELEAGLGIDGKYFVADLTHLGEAYIQKEFPRSRRAVLLASGLDMVRDRLPIVPGVFTTLGGVATDVDGRTAVARLLAAGECACTGVHGADWRAGNTLLAALVFGRRAGRSAADTAASAANGRSRVAEVAGAERERLAALASRTGAEPIHVITGELRRLMSWNVGVLRDRAKLETALEQMRALRRRYEAARVWDTAMRLNEQMNEFLELDSMLLVAEAVARCALAREESRGTHWRRDFERRDDGRWMCHSLIERDAGGQMTLRHLPVQLGEFRPTEVIIR